MSRPIAIVGISAALPSGAYSETNLDHASFFDFLLRSGESYEPIPSTRFNIEAWKGSGIGQVSVDKGSFLKDIDLFDHVEFGISSRDARALSPATRQLLEHSFLALLDSGIDYRKRPVGCYMSGTSIDLSNVANPNVYEPRGSFGSLPAMIANRISNHLDLLGPSIPVDTACSSSLTALHVAVQALEAGDCEAAVVGGCQLNHRLMEWMIYTQSAVLSSDGKCKPFDASADGFGRAEGCVVVVIKPLEDALRDQDHIYATILGTSVNSTGSGGPPGAPVAESQAQAMKQAFGRAGRTPSDVAYVELHATGTAKGDPTEVNWVGENFQRSSELLIGSVKGNIGHTEITAFLVSLSKVISIFEHGIIPPNVNLSTPNPAIKWLEYNLRAPTQPTPLPTTNSNKTLISMSSSGIGGSNGHVVLEAPPQPTFGDPQFPSGRGIDVPILLMATSLSPRTASVIAGQISDVFDTAHSSEYGAISSVLGRRSKQMNWRSYAVTIPAPGTPIQFSSPQYCGRDANPLVFVFSGQGPQHESMGRELFSAFPAFRDSILDMDAVFQRRTNKSMIDDYGLFGAASSSFEFPQVWPIALTLPAIAMFQMALFDLLVHLGVSPDLVLGHSAGETAVLYASGAAPRAMAVELAIIRGQIFSTVEAAGGTMAAVSCTPQEVETLLTQYRTDNPDGVVELACINSPSAVAISGQERSIDEILLLAQQQGIFGRKIRTRVPIHSSMMDVCRQRYDTEVYDLFARYPGSHVPKLRTYSTLTGSEFHGPFDPEYFWRTTRSQVLFAPAISSLSEASTFVEIAPHPVLSSYLFEMVTGSSPVFSVVRRPRAGSSSTEYRDTLEFFGKLTAAGHNCVNFTSLNVSCSGSRVKLQAYPFLKKQFPLFPDTTREDNHYHGPVNRAHLRLNRDTHPTLAEHVIRGEPIWPAAGFLEMALEFGATTLFNINFRTMLPLSAEDPIPVSVTLDGSYWKITPFHGDFAPNNYYLPSRIGEMILHQSPKAGYFPLHVYAYVQFAGWMPDSMHFNVTIVDDLGKRLCTFRNFEVAKHALSPLRELPTPLHIEIQPVFLGIHGPKTAAAPDKRGLLDLNDSDVGASPHSTASVRTCHRLRATISALTVNHSQRVICICVFGDVDLDLFISHVGGILNDFPHVAFELSIPENCTLADDINGPFITVRRQTNPLHAHDFFDIVVSFVQVASSAELDLTSMIGNCDRILLPGGTLLLTDLNHTTRSRIDDPLTSDSSDCKVILTAMGYSVMNTDSSLAHLTVDAQKAAWMPDATAPFDEDTFIFTYKFGEELQLQWDFTLDIWIVALEGTDAGAGLCLTRALRREYLLWNIRFASFPTKFSRETQTNCLRILPTCMNAELDIIFSLTGHPFVPRLLPLAPLPAAKLSSSPTLSGPLDHDQAVLQIHCTSRYPKFSAFTASVIQGYATVDLGTVVPVDQISSPNCIAGVVASVLGPGLSTWNRSHRIHRLSILVTHCDTGIGSTVGEIYRRQGFNVSKTSAAASTLDLARMGHSVFDLIISGYEDKINPQILRTLLRPFTGKLFLWHHELPRILREDPCSIGDALRMAVSRGFLETSSAISVTADKAPLSSESNGHLDPPGPLPFGAVFDPDKTYVILGGLAHGARHLLVTSRSGRETLRAKKNLISRRIFAYLESLEYLNIRLEAVDGASPKAMRAFFDSIDNTLGGCLILSGILADGLFPTLGLNEFSKVTAAKTGVLKTLQETIDTSTLDFVIAFSSLASVLGTGGQANYCAANGALEEHMLAMPNGFAFICPGILDSSMVLLAASRTNYLLAWSISTDEMVLWLDDAIGKFQRGARFRRYLPNLDWQALDQTHGMPKLGAHLVHFSQDITEVDNGGEMIAAKAARIIRNVLSISEEDFDPDVPLTFYGIDSLSAGRLSFALRSILEVTQLQLLADISFTSIIHKFLPSSSDSCPVEITQLAGENSVPTSTLMENYVRKFVDAMDHHSTGKSTPIPTLDSSVPSVHTVLLTGTTGALGCHLLADLLVNDNIRTVYALNRGNGDLGHLIDRQADALVKQGLSPTLAHSEKLTLLIGDLGKDNFGIADEMMTEIRSSVTHIIHNAWKVDFVARLGEFENLISGTARLLQLAILSERAWVCERLVQVASQRRYLNANVIRVGQLTGSAAGTWETTQWFPALAQSGPHIGCLPDGNNRRSTEEEQEISWIPINDAAAAIVDMRSTMNETFHLVHPRPTTWRAVMEPLASILNVPLVPYAEWFARLKSTAGFTLHGPEMRGTSGSLAALKLLDFFQEARSLPRADSHRAIQASKTLRSEHLVPLGSADVEKWVKYWRDVEFLPQSECEGH
ncbi:hypothetical protein K438DRAFT_2135640 [Mycena galopus ATCC 62051]|nr:hypothetical protein K438DRAFT_2135640 [Mycena galopus ATCC 62051]